MRNYMKYCLMILMMSLCFFAGCAQTSKEAEVKETTKKANEPVVIGDTVDTDYGMRMTVLGSGEFDDLSLSKPTEGNILYYVELQYKNISSEEKTVSMYQNFKATCDGKDVEPYLQNVKDFIDGRFESGKEFSGKILFEIPKDWKSLDVVYTPNLFLPEKVTIHIDHE